MKDSSKPAKKSESKEDKKSKGKKDHIMKGVRMSKEVERKMKIIKGAFMKSLTENQEDQF